MMLLLFGHPLQEVRLQALYREMGFTRAEFMQTLPSALRNYSYQISDDLITIAVANGSVTIQLQAEQVRRIALLALPYLPMNIQFISLSDTEFKQFLTQFDLYYRRGGG